MLDWSVVRYDGLNLTTPNVTHTVTYELPEDDLNKIETCWIVFKCFNVNILD